jgi:S-adenosylmethionine-diacylgycerolhomoserine-N-methlytransferase
VSDHGALASLHGYYRWHAHFYDATRWAFLFGRRRLIRQAAAQLRPRRILEVGCGTGRNLAELARFFPDAQIVGLDLSAEMLSKARAKIEAYGPRVTLLERVYNTPISGGDPFDLIVFSYCLSMINPGYDDVLRLCERDLSPQGHLALVDFHDTRVGWFRRWMGVNHVRMEGQILAALEAAGFNLQSCRIRSAYGGLWRWITCLATRQPSLLGDAAG